MHRLIARIRKRRLGESEHDNERGAVFVEFIIVMPILILLTMAIFEFGVWIHAHSVVQAAARQGARTAAIEGAVSRHASDAVYDTLRDSGFRIRNVKRIKGTLQGRSGTHTTAGRTLGTRCSYRQGDDVSITVVFKYESIFPLLRSAWMGRVGSNLGTIRAAATMPAETHWQHGTGPVSSRGRIRCP